MKDRLFEIWFALRCGVQNREFRPLLEACGSPYELYKADENELERLPCSQSLKARLADKSLKEASRVEEYCKQNNVRVLFWQDADYPASLRPLRDPPILLYCKGNLPDLSRRLCISVVGTRSMSEYGKRIAYKIGYELGAAGAVVVSGMALGNDGVAAAGTILAGGSTVAVLGCGLDVTYPREHSVLFEEILNHGAVLSEFAPGIPPEGKNFPIRNRIISALSGALLVVEAGEHSGALITARYAVLQGKPLFAVPGDITNSRSVGTNRLIAEGAIPALDAQGILEHFRFLYRDAIHMEVLPEATQYSALTPEALHPYGLRMTEMPRAVEPRAEKKAAKRRKADTAAAEEEKLPASKPVPDTSALTPRQRELYLMLPDTGFSVDILTAGGVPVSEAVSTLTVLEIYGLVRSVPGGMFEKK